METEIKFRQKIYFRTINCPKPNANGLVVLSLFQIKVRYVINEIWVDIFGSKTVNNS